MAKVDGKYMYK